MVKVMIDSLTSGDEAVLSFRLDRKMLTIKVIEANEDMHPVIPGIIMKDLICALLRASIFNLLLCWVCE